VEDVRGDCQEGEEEASIGSEYSHLTIHPFDGASLLLEVPSISFLDNIEQVKDYAVPVMSTQSVVHQVAQAVAEVAHLVP